MSGMLCLILSLVLSIGGSSPSECPEHCFCNKELTSVNCEGHGLKAIPGNLPKSTEKLYMAHNKIYNLKFTDVGVLPNLQYLWLDNNGIVGLKSNTFNGDLLPKLQYLYLRNNKISVIESYSFANLSSLEEVYLINNLIQKIEQDAFIETPSVKLVNLDSNNLPGIPKFGNLKNLQKLYMQTNSMKDPTFPADYQQLKFINDIGLSNNAFRSLDDNTFKHLQNSGLRKLGLSRNHIDTISKGAFRWFKNIQSLKLGTNPLTSSDLHTAFYGLVGSQLVSLDIDNIKLGGVLPSSTFELLRNTSITTLKLKNNKMSSIPPRGFADLKMLITLDLSNGGIFNISSSAFDGLDALTILFLNDNQLSKVPNNLPPSLEKLYLNGNQITGLEDKTFANLSKLQLLYLGNNKIHSLEQDAFYGLTSLKKLHLVRNIINNLPGRLFSPFGVLESLELNKNNIQRIPNAENLMAPMSSLRYFNMADNSLAVCPVGIFNVLINLQYLHLENNMLGDVIARDNNGKFFAGMNKLLTLNLTNNGLTILPDPLFKDLTSLQNLTLRLNKISTWSDRLFKRTTELESLDLSQNMIALINSSSVKDFTKLKTLYLQQNPFACTCDLRWFRDFIDTTKIDIVQVDTYLCNSPPEWHRKKLLSFDRSKINCLWFTKTQIIITAASVFLLFLIVVVIVYRKRWFIQLRYYRAKRSIKRSFAFRGDEYEKLSGNSLKYDAYISSSEDDYQWVLTNLLPGIDAGSKDDEEFGGEFRLYFDERDSVPGLADVHNMIENMEVSRVILIILTKTYISKGWHEFEIIYASELLYKGVVSDIVIVNVEGVTAKDVPKLLRRKMERHDFIQWEDSEIAKQTFKEQLIDILKRKRKPIEEVI